MVNLYEQNETNKTHSDSTLHKLQKMKKLLIMSTVTLLLSTAVSAQSSVASLNKDIRNDRKEESEIRKEKRIERREIRKLEGREVSYQTKQAFYTDFGNVPAGRWMRTSNFDEVLFTKDGHLMKAYYDYDANLVGTTSRKIFADIPMSAQKFIDKNYKGYSKEKVVLFDDNEPNETDMILYGEQFDDSDNYFVELKKENKAIVLQVKPNGEVSFFKQLKQ